MTNKEIIARLSHVLSPYKRKLFVAMIAMVVVAAFNALQAYIIKPLLDEIFFNKDTSLLNILPIALLLVFLIKGLFYFTYTYLLQWIGQSVIRDLRNAIYTHLNSLSLSFFHKNPTGELISRIMNDVSMLQGCISHAFIYLLRDFFTVLGLLVVIFYMDWKLALISFLFIPAAAIPIVVFGKKFRRISTDYQTEIGVSTNILHETIAGARIVKAFCMERAETARFAKQMQFLFDILMNETRFKSLSHPMVEFMGGIGMALIIWYGGTQVLDGVSTPGTFMAFLTALIMLYEPVKGVSKINSTIQSGMASAARIFNILDVQPSITEKQDAITLPSFSQGIEFRDVTFWYNENEPVLHNLELNIQRGEVLAVVGPSGGGKSTLANLIPRFYEVRQGGVFIDGHDIRDVTMESLRKQIALVTQQTILFNDTIANNIGYGVEHCTEEMIREAARSAHALGFIESLPDGFNTIVGESGARLSGGQQQRVSIARALLKDAPILILDEATSSLDTESEQKVQSALENLMKNRTTIVIAHRLSTIKNADRIVVLKEGHLVESGTHEELLAKGGEYESLYNLQYAD
ncbi:lipid A export permease/ATP-binding protein MsbA [Desulfogranum japonicum]|uniref:lipid A export permease/ATP-binding protein MsbA n=1 Tax=Desulfogranum japonicum TaxID=231447 RepID=UPI00041A4EAB|nr:lipid A export permease/ATP-binding protein MsbA [Desulfogranum japonicum]